MSSLLGNRFSRFLLAGGLAALCNFGSRFLYNLFVDFSTADGTANVDQDYRFRDGTVTFAPGETQRTITVEILNDNFLESQETFFLNLFSANGAVLGDAQAVGTIFDQFTTSAEASARLEPKDSDVTATFGVRGQYRDIDTGGELSTPATRDYTLAGYAGGLAATLLRKALPLSPEEVRHMRERAWACDGALIEQELGWRPALSLEEGMAQTLRWYREHKWL